MLKKDKTCHVEIQAGKSSEKFIVKYKFSLGDIFYISKIKHHRVHCFLVLYYLAITINH